MKKVIYAAVLCLLAAACSTENQDVVINDQAVVPVTVQVDEFSMSQEDFPGAVTRTDPSSIAGFTKVKAVTLAFFDGSTPVYSTTQYRDDASTYTTFGVFSLSLPMGSYTMVVLGYGFAPGDELTLTSPTQAAFTAGSVREMFTATQAVSITNTNAVNLSATLSRVVAKLQVVSTDAKTANAANVRMTFSAGSNAFSPTTGLATENTGATSTTGISAAVGETSLSNAFVFLASDTQTMDVTIDVLDADGASISHKEVTNVPFKRNRITKLTGSLYSAGSSSSFLLDTDWDTTENNVSF